jgi:hypothetical protein
MKFTRIFILKALTTRDKISDNQNPFEVLKELIICHPNIDFTISLLLSIILFLTNFNYDIKYVYSNSINIYLINTLNFTILMFYFILEYIDVITYTGTTKNTNIGNNLNDASNSNNISSQVYTSSIPFQSINPIYIFSFGYPNKIKIPDVLHQNYHLFKASLYLLKIIFSIFTYFLALLFCVLYSEHKTKLDKNINSQLHLFALDFYDFYSGFRLCYFLIKLLTNIFLVPVYLSAIILAIVEDRFNYKLNNLVNTKHYAGRTSIKNITSGRASDLEEYCSICLNPFQLEELVSTLPCSRRHTFHTSCLEKWFLTTVTCPLCRSDFQTSVDFIINPNHREVRPFDLEQNLLQ